MEKSNGNMWFEKIQDDFAWEDKTRFTWIFTYYPREGLENEIATQKYADTEALILKYAIKNIEQAVNYVLGRDKFEKNDFKFS